MANKLLGVSCGEELGVKTETAMDEHDKSCKALANLSLRHAELRKSGDSAKQFVGVQMKGSRVDHACKLVALRNLCQASECGLRRGHNE